MPPCTLPPKLTSVGWARKRKVTSFCWPGMAVLWWSLGSADYARRRLQRHRRAQDAVGRGPLRVGRDETEVPIHRQRAARGVEGEAARAGTAYRVAHRPLPQAAGDAAALVAGGDEEVHQMAVVAHRRDADQ